MTLQYTELSEREHVLHRPDSYIGITTNQTNDQFIFENDKIIWKQQVTYNPGLLKLFDEALMNARDHSINDNTCTQINIDYDLQTGSISIMNNGKSMIPVNDDIPKRLFSELRCSSNFDDTKQNITAGKNGMGITLTNIWSKLFNVEILNNGQLYTVEYSNNMENIGESNIENVHSNVSEKNYVKISFIPDYQRLKTNLTQNIPQLIKRVHDLKFTCPRVSIKLNNQEILAYGYIDMYRTNNIQKEICQYFPQNQWSVHILPVINSKFQQISFVNGIHTPDSKTSQLHYVLKQIVKQINERMKIQIKASDIKSNNLYLFINSCVINATYTSQTKECLKYSFNGKHKEFYSKIVFSDQFIDQLFSILKLPSHNKPKINKQLQLDSDIIRAKKEGTKHTKLFITEGKSAAQFIEQGMTTKDRDNYGIFPLRGKPLNITQLVNSKEGMDRIWLNKEISQLILMVGLKFEQQTFTKLKYKQIVIATDQDVDGTQICGLIMNIFYRLWPGLLELPQFITRMITPIIVQQKGTDLKNQFFSQYDYEQSEIKQKNYEVQYVKGLGFWQQKHAQFFMKFLDHYQMNFNKTDKCKDSLDLAFDQRLSDSRKVWINSFNSKMDNLNYNSIKFVSYTEFVNKDLIHHSLYNIQRAIPAIDGFKVSQRKVMYAMLMNPNISAKKKDMKVEQLASYISEFTSYHHGQVSLQGTITKMAQDFCGSNNLNLLVPQGQFGSRKLNGGDAAAARYTHTRLSDVCKFIIKDIDLKDEIISECIGWNYDDNQRVEPKLIPVIIPLCLINGQIGIGTGYSTQMFNHNVLTIIDILISTIQNNGPISDQPGYIVPYYRKYLGTITNMRLNKHGYFHFESIGKYEVMDTHTLRIYELPLEISARQYETEVLIPLMEQGHIKYYSEGPNVEFTVHVENILKIQDKLRLSHNHLMSNMLLIYDSEVKKYTNQIQIINDFYYWRFPIYKKRYEYVKTGMQNALDMLSNKIKFIELDIKQTFKYDNINRFYEQLNQYGFTDPKVHKYLEKLTIRQKTQESMQKLIQEQQHMQLSLNQYVKQSPKTLWLNELRECRNFIIQENLY